jgi:hypothetical protein
VSHKDGRVVLSAWVEPVLRDLAREAAKIANLEFSRWVSTDHADDTTGTDAIQARRESW